MKSWSRLARSLPILCLLLVGCSGSNGDDNRPSRVPVTGSITYKGQPVEGAQVVFSPKSPDGTAAAGTTDESGRFELTTFTDNDGAIPGSYNVTVSKHEARPPAPEFDDASYDPDAKPLPPAKSLLPVKYKDPGKSALTADVAEGQAEFQFDLQD